MRRFGVLLVAASLLVGGVAACGGDDDDDDGGDATAAFCEDWNDDEGGDQPVEQVEASLELMEDAREDAPEDVAAAMDVIGESIETMIGMATDGVVTEDIAIEVITTTEGSQEAATTISEHCG